MIPILGLVCLWNLLGSPSARAETPNDFIIYTYDSIVAKGGLGPEIFPRFEKICGCHVRALPSGDGAQLLTRLQLDAERGKPTAHVILGIDQQIWERAKPLIEPWGDWSPKNYTHIATYAQVGSGFLPFDYGVMAFMVDQQALDKAHLKPPNHLRDLLKPEWRKNIILEDPRTSTPGLGFLLYVNAALGADAPEFWLKFRGQWLTLASSWDAAYGLFLKQEAPLVWSYTTSQAYHVEHGDTHGRHHAIVFEEGQPVQVEGAAWVKGAIKTERDRKRAKSFLDFMISPEVQKLIATKNWMLPVMPNTPVPKSFSNLPKSAKLYKIQSAPGLVEKSLADWSRALAAP